VAAAAAESARDRLHQRIQRRNPPSKINHTVIITTDQASVSQSVFEKVRRAYVTRAPL
jgi:hypothetical protein